MVVLADWRRIPATAGYETVGSLGQGGKGISLEAKQLSLGRRVTIKVMTPELAQHERAVLRLQKETAAMAALSRSIIVSCIRSGGNRRTLLLCHGIRILPLGIFGGAWVPMVQPLLSGSIVGLSGVLMLIACFSYNIDWGCGAIISFFSHDMETSLTELEWPPFLKWLMFVFLGGVNLSLAGAILNLTVRGKTLREGSLQLFHSL